MAQLAVAGAGAFIGSFFGPIGISIGWAIGSFIGGMLFPPPGQTFEGPRLKDTAIQTSTDGAPIAEVYGTLRVAGNIFWSTPILETRHEDEVEAEGAKGGGPSATSITYTYSVSLAIGLCEGPITGIRRVWADSKLFYSIADGADPSTFASNTERGVLRFYLGTETQTADPLISATEGATVTPAYRGVAYVVFEGFQLADFANRIPNFEFEVVSAGAQTFPYLSKTLGAELGTHITVDANSLWSYHVQDTINAGDHVWRWDMTSNAAEAFITITAAVVTALNGEVRCIVIDPDEDELILFGGGLPACRWARYDRATGALLSTYVAVTNGVSSSGGSDPINTRQGYFYSQKTRTFLAIGEGYNSGQTYVIAADPKLGVVTWIWGGLQPNGIASNRQPMVDSHGDVWITGNLDLVLADIRRPILYRAPDGMVPASAFLWAARGEIWVRPNVSFPTNGWSVFDLTARTWSYSVSLGLGSWTTSYELGVEDVYGNVWFTHHTGGPQMIDASLRTTSGTAVKGFTGLNIGSTTLFSLRYIPGVVMLDKGGAATNFYADALGQVGWDLSDVVEDLCAKAGVASVNATSLIGQTVRGYTRSRPMAARAAITPLGLAYGFDAVESDGTINFVLRGGASILTLTNNDLGVKEGDIGEASTDLIVSTRALETELPAALTVGFFNIATDYEVSSSRARRLVSRAEQSVFVELPLALTSSEAAQIADKLMRQAWLERTRYEFTMGPENIALNPTDVITLPDGSRVRVTKTTLNATDVIACEAVGDDSGALISYSTGATDERGEDILIGTGGLSIGLPLDLPLLLDQHVEEGLYLAATHERTGWTGAMFYDSLDNGATWSALFPTSSSARLGRIISASVSTTARSGLWDSASYLVVRLTDPTLTLSSASSLLAFYNGENAAAIGNEVDGWEIIQFYTVVDNGDDTYTLKNLLRGRRGTDWAISRTVSAGDKFVVLESPEVGRTAFSLTNIGREIELKAVTLRGSISDAPTKVFTFDAVSLLPYPPVAVYGAKQATNNFDVNWKRRARKKAEWLNSIDVPLDETVETYVVEFYDEDFLSLKRSTSVTTTSLTYTNSQVTTDFGLIPTAIGARIYQVSGLVGNGYAGDGVIGRPDLLALHWDPARIPSPSAMLFSNNDFTVTKSGTATHNYAVTTRYFSEGKWYWEVGVELIVTADASLGATKSTSLAQAAPVSGTHLMCRADGTMTPTGTGGFTWTTSDVLMFAMDTTNGSLYMGKNGSWQNAANPVTGQSAQCLFAPGTAAWAPVFATNNGNATNATVNGRFSGGHQYTIPTGYVPLN